MPERYILALWEKNSILKEHGIQNDFRFLSVIEYDTWKEGPAVHKTDLVACEVLHFHTQKSNYS